MHSRFFLLVFVLITLWGNGLLGHRSHKIIARQNEGWFPDDLEIQVGDSVTFEWMNSSPQNLLVHAFPRLGRGWVYRGGSEKKGDLEGSFTLNNLTEGTATFISEPQGSKGSLHICPHGGCQDPPENCRESFPKPNVSSFLLSEYCFDQFCDLVGTEKEIFVLLKNAAEIYLANDSDTVLERSSLLIDATNGIILEVGTTAAISHRLNNTQKSSSFSLIEIDLNFESSIIPGLVGMHEHLFYPGKGGTLLYSIQTSSSPLLYLARGVTTARTTGSMHPYADLFLHRSITQGVAVGPRFLPTAPYLDGNSTVIPQFYPSPDPNSTVAMMESWRMQGFNEKNAGGGWKSYMWLTRDQIASAIQDAHANGEKVTGHLCSVTWNEALDRGINNLEHGLMVASDFVPDKVPDECPDNVVQVLVNLDLNSQPVQDLIDRLVQTGVPVTSTLAVFEALIPHRPPLSRVPLRVLIDEAAEGYLQVRKEIALINSTLYSQALAKEMEFELMLVQKGGNLVAGADPTGVGGVVAGYADLRGIELLVEAGFTIPEAIGITTRNGARYLGPSYQKCVGGLGAGFLADFSLVKGVLSEDVANIQDVYAVFHDGFGFDSEKLIKASTRTVSWV